MRTPIIAGNWKMNKTPQEAAALINELKPLVKDAAVTVVVCVPAIDIPAAVEAAKGSNVNVGAQNVHFKTGGAYTGEISAEMLLEAGVSHVIIGHSERRQYFGETDETVNLRTLAAVRAGLTPIVCVGELKEQREAGYTDALVAYQTLIALSGLTATDEQANDTIGVIREAIAGKYGRETADKVRIQYGGSMNPGNVKGLMAQPEIDGGLIGGASLKAEDFSKVVKYQG